MTMSGWATPAFKQPWTYGEPYTSINRKYLKLRERLLPYFYSYAAEAHRTGAPLNRSLVLEYPNDPKTWGDATKYEFLAGKEFLVAPMWGADEVKSGIYLPEGNWVDYWTGKVYQGPTTVNGYHATARHAAAVRQGRRGGPDVEERHQLAPPSRASATGSPSTSTRRASRPSRSTRTTASPVTTSKTSPPANCWRSPHPSAARGDVTVKIGASRGSYAGKPATRPYELTVHTGTAPREVDRGRSKLTKLVSKNAYLAASTGWYYENGVVLVKTASTLDRSDATVRLDGHHLGRRRQGGLRHLRHARALFAVPVERPGPGHRGHRHLQERRYDGDARRTAGSRPAGRVDGHRHEHLRQGRPGQDGQHQAGGDPRRCGETGQFHPAAGRVVQGGRRRRTPTARWPRHSCPTHPCRRRRTSSA